MFKSAARDRQWLTVKNEMTTTTDVILKKETNEFTNLNSSRCMHYLNKRKKTKKKSPFKCILNKKLVFDIA